MSVATTEGIHVEAEPRYLPEQSNPAAGEFLFAYQITIANVGEAPARLISRHWVITDSLGERSHVKGPGVVGEQPRLEPGEAFRYTSYCPLPTPVGTMEGTFQMRRDTGEQFDARVAPFTLAAPHALN